MLFSHPCGCTASKSAFCRKPRLAHERQDRVVDVTSFTISCLGQRVFRHCLCKLAPTNAVHACEYLHNLPSNFCPRPLLEKNGLAGNYKFIANTKAVVFKSNMARANADQPCECYTFNNFSGKSSCSQRPSCKRPSCRKSIFFFYSYRSW